MQRERIGFGEPCPLHDRPPDMLKLIAHRQRMRGARGKCQMDETDSESRRWDYFEVIIIGLAAIIVGMLVAHWLGFY
jgi:hypothetical protein